MRHGVKLKPKPVGIKVKTCSPLRRAFSVIFWSFFEEKKALSFGISGLKSERSNCCVNVSAFIVFFFFPTQATALKIHPLYVMLPCTIAASLAFMLPVATPPNAIAFSYGNLKVIDMVRAFGVGSIEMNVLTCTRASR